MITVFTAGLGLGAAAHALATRTPAHPPRRNVAQPSRELADEYKRLVGQAVHRSKRLLTVSHPVPTQWWLAVLVGSRGCNAAVEGASYTSDFDFFCVAVASSRVILSCEPPEELVKNKVDDRPDFSVLEVARLVQLLRAANHRAVEVLFQLHRGEADVVAVRCDCPLLDELVDRRHGFVTGRLLGQLFKHVEGEVRRLRKMRGQEVYKKVYLVLRLLTLSEEVAAYKDGEELRVYLPDESPLRARLLAVRAGQFDVEATTEEIEQRFQRLSDVVSTQQHDLPMDLPDEMDSWLEDWLWRVRRAYW